MMKSVFLLYYLFHSLLNSGVPSCFIMFAYGKMCRVEMLKVHSVLSFVRSNSMNSPSTHFITSRRINMYEPMHQMNAWAENFKSHGNLNIPTSMIVEVDTKLDNQSEDTSHGTHGHSYKYDQETPKSTDKVKRRLAQNREAARKSRLRKKAYVKQLESSRHKLVQLEQELVRGRQHGQYIEGGLETSHLGCSAPVNSGITAFEVEYRQWVVEQDRQIYELRTALNANTSHTQINLLVENGMSHYFKLFRMKATAAKTDVFYLISGIWKTPSERFFLWIGGSRPSELLKVLLPQLDSLSDQQLLDVYNLKQSCQQAEDALSQGMDKLQLNVAETVAAGQLGEGNYSLQIATAMDKLEALVAFANQADHLRQEALQQMARILSIYQTARCLLALGEYFQRLRALSSLWATRGREPV